MANEPKTQWHPAFYSAIKLELKDDAEHLQYTSEYNLNTKPLEVDLLIVKKEKDIEIKNEIGKIFRKHNIIEYKSPEDSLNLNTYLKVVAYACLYKSYEEHVDDIMLDEITITLIREMNPRKLMHWFAKNGYQIDEVHKGIYYVTREHHFPMQVIVSSRLSKESQKWLTLLSSHLEQTDAERIVWQVDSLKQGAEKRYGDSVLQVAMQENAKLFNKLKEDETVCEALKKLMEPEWNEGMKRATEQGLAKGMAQGLEEGMAQGMAQGMEQGLKKGMKQAVIDTVRKSLSAGNSMEDIARIMQIPLEEVKSIAEPGV